MDAKTALANFRHDTEWYNLRLRLIEGRPWEYAKAVRERLRHVPGVLKVDANLRRLLNIK